jgi:predicted lysophospholipase L1 biosynthesis ABC-type transport system permease subunit
LDVETIPVVANTAFLAAIGAAEGQTIDVTIDGERRHLSVDGVVDSFPTTDPARPLLLMDGATLDLLRMQARGTTVNVDEWWLSVTPDASAEVSDTLRAHPFDSTQVVSAVDKARSLSTDPVALGIIGALLLGFVATGIFALIALIVSAAVSARQRRTEFALLRALGLSGGQLSRWLWLENGSLVLASLVGGTVVGVVISSIALPFSTVTQQGTTPVPRVIVHLPWDRILLLDLVVVIALGLAVAILAAVLRRIGVGTILRLGED